MPGISRLPTISGTDPVYHNNNSSSSKKKIVNGTHVWIPHHPPGSSALKQQQQQAIAKSNNKKFRLDLIESDGENKCEKLADIGQKYLEETSLHGLKYLVEKSRHVSERCFWLVAITISWIAAIGFISQLFVKWKDSPVLVSFDSVPIPIWEIPFPGITICNMNKVRKSRVENIENELLLHPDNQEYLTEREFVKEICGSHGGGHGEEPHGNETESHDHGHGHADVGGGGGQDLNLSGEKLHFFLHDMSHHCDEMLLRCFFEGHERDCMEIFISTVTDAGECCSFNIMPESVMFENDVTEGEERSSEKIKSDLEEEERWNAWSMQNGYNFSYGEHDERMGTPEENLPRRGIAPGLHMGLSVLMDVQEEEYYCTGTESVGFKALLHTPVQVPELVEFGFALKPGTESFFSVVPEMIHADEAIHKFSYHKRQCYLHGEKHLQYFRHYSFLNCFLECASNFTYQHCGCVAFYMPRNPTTMPICAPEKNKCVEEAILIVEETGFDDSHDTETNCKCLPSCTDIEFPHESSISALKRADLLTMPKETRENHPKYSNDTYVQNNLALFHVYFKKLHFMRHERAELYSAIDFFSNIGGLLGLCMGLSALSVAEFIYFFTMRLIFNISLFRSEKAG